MTTKAEREQEQTEARDKLRELFPVGSTVTVLLRHVSQSGMSRAISVIGPDLEDVSYLVARATGDKIDQRHGGIKVGGCGMDMGFHLVYGLARTIYREFPCTGGDGFGADGCPSNDHSNGDRDYTPGRLHSDGGYALRHRWL